MIFNFYSSIDWRARIVWWCKAYVSLCTYYAFTALMPKLNTGICDTAAPINRRVKNAE